MHRNTDFVCGPGNITSASLALLSFPSQERYEPDCNISSALSSRINSAAKRDRLVGDCSYLTMM